MVPMASLVSLVSSRLLTTTDLAHLILWNSTDRKLNVIEPKLGGLVASISLPNIVSLLTDSVNHGSLFGITDNNYVLRLAPRR